MGYSGFKRRFSGFPDKRVSLKISFKPDIFFYPGISRDKETEFRSPVF